VFLVDDADIRRLCRCTNVGGFYLSRVSGSIAFSGKGGWTDANNNGRLVLFHEYAHHFLLGTYNAAFPAFYSEGFAEFASTMKIAEDSAMIGIAAQHRAYGLLLGQRFTAAQMFDPALRAKLKTPEQIDAFYGRGWLLTHYLTFDKARFGQFNAYLKALNTGTPSTTAAEQAFGDLKTLNGNVNAYLARARMPAMTMLYRDEAVSGATVRRLSPGEAALIDLRMESVRGVDRDSGRKLYAKAAAVGARFADDPVAQGWLAEMAYDAGEDDAAEAAAARAIARDAKSTQALLYRGMVKLRRAQAAKASDAAVWAEARRSIVAANRVDPDDAEPLWWFWLSFAMQGIEPTPSAFKGLYRAQELAPQDDQVRFAAAVARIDAGEVDPAKKLLRPLAYSPHAPADNPASRIVCRCWRRGRRGRRC
jgi:tetratricopeptide (TPR) repeat protein